jgi:hypothetical protein
MALMLMNTRPLDNKKMNLVDYEETRVDSEHVNQVKWNNIWKQKKVRRNLDNPKNLHLELLGLAALIQIQNHRLT